ncbi:MAG TPA: aldose epimerase [Cyanobacteria bacterium UBA11149]|nr:aldose epimerase [Cyanobacteria bacterium UBA11149]
MIRGVPIAKTQRDYETYILTDYAAGASLEVVPERGGIISRWCLQNQEILYLDEERFKNPNLSVRGGIPILFPICGNLPNHTYIHKGQEYQLHQHGFARDLPWQVIDKVTNGCASLILSLKSNQETLAVYPFEFEVVFTYLLAGNTLEIQQRYTNHSDEAMPFATGFHPYFFAPDKSQLHFEIPASEYQNQQNQDIHPFNGGFDWQEDEIDVGFRQLTANSATVTDTGRGLKIAIAYSDIYSTLVFWTLKGKDFYCLEPWSAPRNALNTGDCLIQLPPGASLETSVKLAVTF